MKRQQSLTDRGYKFRRQHPVGPFFADYCCVEVQVIVELDGNAQLGREEEDRKRDDYLRGQGYVVLRFENCETKWNEAYVREKVYFECRSRIAG